MNCFNTFNRDCDCGNDGCYGQSVCNRCSCCPCRCCCRDGEDGQDGIDGLTPFIGENKNWFIGETDTGVLAEGKDGINGQDGANGRDGIDGQDGTDGLTPFIGENKNWFIGETDTGVLAEGKDGKDAPTFEKAYMFAASYNRPVVEYVYTLADEQVMKGFTPDENNTHFTAGVAGVYLVSYRLSFQNTEIFYTHVSRNGNVIPASIYGIDANQMTTAFIIRLEVGDVLALERYASPSAPRLADGIGAYLCATRIDD